MLERIETALQMAYRRTHAGAENVVVVTDKEKAEIKLVVRYNVVEEVLDPDNEISLTEAKKISPKLELSLIHI